MLGWLDLIRSLNNFIRWIRFGVWYQMFGLDWNFIADLERSMLFEKAKSIQSHCQTTICRSS
jgi:hypothetical protein